MDGRKGSKNKPKIIENPGPGHNSQLTDEQLQVLVFQHKKEYAAALAKKKEADAALKNVCKKAKAELGAGAVDDIKLAIELDSDEGQARLREEMDRKARVAGGSAWMSELRARCSAKTGRLVTRRSALKASAPAWPASSASLRPTMHSRTPSTGTSVTTMARRRSATR